MKHNVLFLNEQKYVGIKTEIRYCKHDSIDFLGLHFDLINANIHHINYQEQFIAIDTDFTKDSFSYVPLIPVDSFNNNEDFFHFRRKAGKYYAFSVVQKNCNPDWFKRVFAYMKEKNINVVPTGYDIEYYSKNYMASIKNKSINFEETIFDVLFLAEDS